MRFFATTHLRKGKSTHLVVQPLRKTFLKRVLRKGHLVVEEDIVVQVLVAEAPHKLWKRIVKRKDKKIDSKSFQKSDIFFFIIPGTATP